MKHTPGPWTAISNELGTFIRCKNDYLITGPINDRPDGIDNARLIAAAPDLYEALEEVVKDALDFVERTGQSIFWLDKAEAALAKAKGEI